MPTIAVATNGGVSVIKDDGTVVDYVGSSQGSDAPVDKISFIGSSKLLFSHRYASEVVNLVSSDNSAAYYNQLYSFTGRITNSISHDDDIHVSALSSDDNIESIALNEEDAASKSVSGLSLANHYQVASDPDRISCFITSDYNTGWMNGDIKLATLSSTADTSYTYDHSGITQRDSGRIASHTYTTGATSWDVVDDTTNSAEGYFGLTIPTEDGKQYTIYHTRSVLLTDANAQNHIQFVSGPDTTLTINWADGSTDLSDSITFTAQGSSIRYVVYSRNNATTTHTINVTLAEQDRSVNKNGLQEYGTVTKTAVATGADLMAYSGFDAGTFLRQPYNSDLNPGTGAVTTMGWYKTTNTNGSYRTIVYANTVRPSGGNIASGHQGWQILINPSNQIYYYVYGPSADAQVTHSSTTNDGAWHFFYAVTSANNNHSLYVDGV